MFLFLNLEFWPWLFSNFLTYFPHLSFSVYLLYFLVCIWLREEHMDILGLFSFLKICSKPTYGEVSSGFKISEKPTQASDWENTCPPSPVVCWERGKDDVGGDRKRRVWGIFEGDIHNLGQNFYGDAWSCPFTLLWLPISSATTITWKWMGIAGRVLQSKTYRKASLYRGVGGSPCSPEADSVPRAPPSTHRKVTPARAVFSKQAKDKS